MNTQHALGRARGYESPPHAPDATIIVAEYPLNRHHAFRAEIVKRDGKSVVSLSRWKNTPSGLKRTGQAFEFGAHRVHDVLRILHDVAGMTRAGQHRLDGGASSEGGAL